MKLSTIQILSRTTLLLSLVATLSCNQKQGTTVATESKPQAYVIKPSEGESLPDIASLVKVSPETGSQSIITIATEMKPGIGTGLHYHEDTDEIFYIIEGKGFAVLGDTAYTIEEGDLIFIPKNTDHKIRNNDSTRFLKVLFFFDKPGLLKSFREEHQQFYIEKKPHSLETGFSRATFS